MPWRHVLNWPAQLTAIHAVLLLLFALSPATGAGQRFFDDFDGEDLGSHWSIGNPKGGWIYSVHDSLLDVHGFAGFSASQWIYAHVGAYEDFDLRAHVGWVEGDSPFQSLSVQLFNNLQGGFVAGMTYRLERLDGRARTTITADIAEGPRVDMSGPADGFHHFRISREASQFTAYFDGQKILQGNGTSADAVYIRLLFRGRLQPASTQLYVDSVGVVPEPSAAVLVASGLAALALRRNGRHL
ncbi:MAG: PEP-CTERM sorting domain-containing protein [Armatimonadota bacterium]